MGFLWLGGLSWIPSLSKADGTLKFLSLLSILGNLSLRIVTALLSLSCPSYSI